MSSVGGRTALLLLLSFLAPVAGRSQSPVERAALQRYRDSLAAIRDTTQLQCLADRALAEAKVARDNPLVHLRRGFVVLRLLEASRRSDVDDAASEFEWAAELRPEWPYPWLGLGLAEAQAPNRAGAFAGGLYTMFGLDRQRKAGEAFARAVQLDPMFVEGLVSFAQTALQQQIGPPLLPALEAVRAATASPAGWHPALLLERGRLERLVGDPDSARVVFLRAVALSRDPSVAWVELARTLPLTADTLQDLPHGPSTVERAYFNAAASDNAESVRMLRRDLEPIVNDSVLAAFDAMHGAARVEWLRTFWETRGAVDLRAPASRLAEHLRRWAVARRQFQLPPFKRRYRWGFELYRSGDAELDDRGIIWLRHGEPAARVVWPRSRSAGRVDLLRTNSGNESWRYDRPEGDLVLHFVATDDEDDFRLVENALDLDVASDQLQRRADEFPGLARLLRAGPNTISWITEEERLRGRRSVAVATRTDSWERQYPTLLSGHAQWLPAGVRDGLPLVHLVYAVDAAALRKLPGQGKVALTVRAVFLDRNGVPTATLDTVQMLDRPSPEAKMVALRAEVAVPSGRQMVRLGVEATPAVGAVYPVDSLVVPTIDEHGLSASALLLGRPSQALSWQPTPRDTAWLDVLGVYAPRDTVTVYAELYGATQLPGTAIRLTIRRQRGGLARLLGRGGDEITIRESLGDVTSPVHWRRDVALGGLAPGSYLLEFSAESGGEKVVRRRGVTIRDRE
ncbi:MAG: hypothetical protein ABIZ70_06480 [Gemmatimonadales bacterium]